MAARIGPGTRINGDCVVDPHGDYEYCAAGDLKAGDTLGFGDCHQLLVDDPMAEGDAGGIVFTLQHAGRFHCQSDFLLPRYVGQPVRTES
jgi:hypothetical protein